MAFAMIVLIIGFLMLFERMGVISNEWWGYFWPLAIIAIGLSMMFNKMTRDHYWDECCMRGHHAKKHTK